MNSTATSKITIGRGSTNDIIVSNPEVSRKHAVVTLITDHVLLLEDQESTYGTMVNGQRIARKIIGLDDKVMLADKEPLDLRLLLARFSAQAPPPPPRMDMPPPPPPVAVPPPISKQDPLDFREEFKKLAEMQEVYTQAREAIQINSPRHQAWLRGAFGVAGPLIGAALTIGTAGTFAGIALVGTLVAAVGQIVASQAINPTEKLLALDKEFKRMYVCPNPECKRFLGNAVYADLVHQKQCSRCKAKWV